LNLSLSCRFRNVGDAWHEYHEFPAPGSGRVSYLKLKRVCRLHRRTLLSQSRITKLVSSHQTPKAYSNRGDMSLSDGLGPHRSLRCTALPKEPPPYSWVLMAPFSMLSNVSKLTSPHSLLGSRHNFSPLRLQL